MPARTDFKVYGPTGIRHLTERLFGRDGAFKVDLRGMSDAESRAASSPSMSSRSLEWPAVHVTEVERLIGPGVVVSTRAWQVRATFSATACPRWLIASMPVDARS